MRIKILTLFKKQIEDFLKHSIIAKAIDEQKISIEVIDIRAYSDHKHKKVDDKPYGGGAGMLMQYDVLHKALSAHKGKAYTIITSPAGKLFTQAKAKKLSKKAELLIICGHYEGYDHRIIEDIDEEISIGNYVLTGGELAALAIVDATIRLSKGVINDQSLKDESFNNNLLEYPQYTRPYSYNNRSVPKVLLSGNHELIRRYRLKEALKRTYYNKRSLIKKEKLTKEMQELLAEIIKESKC